MLKNLLMPLLANFRRRYGPALLLPCLLFTGFRAAAQPDPATITINLSQRLGELRPFWSWFGYDEPNYTNRPYGKKLLSELTRLGHHPVYVRTHNLLTSKGMSPGPDLKWGFTNAYSEDSLGRPVYNWTILDSIIDTYIQRGIKPLMEIGFMPEALSSKPDPYEHSWSRGGNLWTGWTAPPKDFNKWRELVYQWARHSISRYGRKEVASWIWEVWNEPNISYWSGSFEEFCKLYDYAADGLKKACPECRIGGPHTTSPRSDQALQFLMNFITHCLRGINWATGKPGTPLEYIGFHAKGSPEYTDGKIRMNMGAQLNDIQRGFSSLREFPELKNIPVIIGECDPEGCAACSAARDPRYGYRNGTMYSSYTAASFARIYELMDSLKVNLQGAVSWSFEFEDQDWFAGFRELATHGIDKPVLNVFRMLGKMKGSRLAVQSSQGKSATAIIEQGVRDQPDIHALASIQGHNAWILVWNYHDLDQPAPARTVELTLQNLVAKKWKVRHYRIDQNHSNAFEKWKAMGSPQQVKEEQYRVLERAGQLEELGPPQSIQRSPGPARLRFELPAQGLSLLEISW